MKTLNREQLITVHPARTARRFWLLTGAALLTWQLNNQIVRADTQVTPTSTGTENVEPAKTNTNQQKLGSTATSQGSATQSAASIANGEPQPSAASVKPQGSSATGSAPSNAPAVNKNSQEPSQQASAASSATSEDQQAGSVKQPESATSQSGEKAPIAAATSAVKTDSDSQVLAPSVNKQPKLKLAKAVQREAEPASPASGQLGTCEWSIDTSSRTLHIGPGTLPDTTGVETSIDGNGHTKVTNWGNLDWNNYLDTNGLHPSLLLSIDGKVTVGADASYLLSGLRISTSGNLDSKLSNLNTQNTTNMTGMFANSDINGDMVINFDTSHVTNMSHMFADVQNWYLSNEAESAILTPKFDTSKVTDMSYMFYNLGDFHHIDVSSFNTANVTNMSYMFYSSYSLEELNVSNFDTSHVISMAGMFDFIFVEDLDLSNFNTSRVTDMSNMFSEDNGLKKLDVSSFDTSNVTNMSGMFRNLDLSAGEQLDLKNFNTSKVTDMSFMFRGFRRFTGACLENFDTRNVTNMQSMFEKVNAGNNGGPITPSEEFSTLDLTHLDTSNVTNMSGMFAGNPLLTHLSLNLPNFKTAKVTDMSRMFADDPVLVDVDLTNFDTSNVENMEKMFNNDVALTTLDLSGLDTSKVTNMADMFMGDTYLKQLDLHHFDTQQVKFMRGMFAGDSALEELDLSSFDMRNLVDDYLNFGNFDWKMFALFNLPAELASELNLSDANSRILKLGPNTRLSVDWPLEQLSDFTNMPAQATGVSDEEQALDMLCQMLGYSTVADLKEHLFTANLLPAGGPTGLWVNADTGERLSASELMARYSGDQATAGTWVWQTIVGKDTELIASPKTTWAPKDNFDQAVDETNQSLPLDQLQVTLRDANNHEVDRVDPTQAGKYTVTYSYMGEDGINQTSGPVNLIILANQDAIDAHDSVIQLGGTWQATANLVSATDADGSDALSKVTSTGTVDTQTPGVYTITYTFDDQFKVPVTKSIQVVVNGLTLNQKDLQVSTDDHWEPLANLAQAVDDHGRPVKNVSTQFTNVATNQGVTSLRQPGQYLVTYWFDDDHGQHVQTATVTIQAGENHANLQLVASQVQLYEHDTWDPMSNIQRLIDADGTEITALNWPQYVQVNDSVNPDKVGQYPVEYRFIDQFGTEHTATTLVTVKANQAHLNLKASQVTLYVGQTWQPEANVAAIVDVDGQLVAPSQLKISGQLNLTQPGQYLMTYQFTDQRQHLHTATTLVTVLANQAHLTVKAPVVALTVGDQWVALDNLQAAMDVDGSLVAPAALKIDNPTNNQVPGTYLVTYQFTDQLGQVQQATTKVIVKAATVVNPDDNSGQDTDPDQQPDEPTPTPDPDVPAPKPGVPTTDTEQPTETQPVDDKPAPISPVTTPSEPRQPQPTTVKPAKQQVAQQPSATMTFTNTAQIMLAPAKLKLAPSSTKLTSTTGDIMPTNQSHRQTLPQTNEQHSWLAAIGTMLLAVVTTMMAWIKGKQTRRKD